MYVTTKPCNLSLSEWFAAPRPVSKSPDPYEDLEMLYVTEKILLKKKVPVMKPNEIHMSIFNCCKNP